MLVGELKMVLDQYDDDVQVGIATGPEGEDGFFEVAATYDDEISTGKRGFFIQTGNELPPL